MTSEFQPLERGRADTDESLRSERACSDEEVAKERRATESRTDSETERRRTESDADLDGHRARADTKVLLAQGGPAGRAVAKQVIAAEREHVDDLREVERAEADTSLDAERTEKEAIVEHVLERERERTDEKLCDERSETDVLVEGHRSEIEDRKRSEATHEQRHRQKDELLSAVSHDLRDPLNVILMNARLICDHAPHGDVGQRMRRWAETTLRTGQRMERLVADLLDSAAIDAGTLSVTREPVEAAALVHDAVEGLSPLATAKGVTLAGDGGAFLVSCDAQRVAQVLGNLLGNAIEHTPSGGSIEVTASDGGGTMARLAVRDTGVGMSQAELDHAFERGWQAKAGRGGGLGLGLAIARGLVHAQDGEIGIESEPGRGTTVWFTLHRA